MIIIEVNWLSYFPIDKKAVPFMHKIVTEIIGYLRGSDGSYWPDQQYILS